MLNNKKLIINNLNAICNVCKDMIKYINNPESNHMHLKFERQMDYIITACENNKVFHTKQIKWEL